MYAEEVKVETPTPAPAPAAPVKTYYRVRKTWADSKSQIGAYTSLENAKEKCQEAGEGYHVFDDKGNIVYSYIAPTPAPAPETKPEIEIIPDLKPEIEIDVAPETKPEIEIIPEPEDDPEPEIEINVAPVLPKPEPAETNDTVITLIFNAFKKVVMAIINLFKSKE